MNVYPDLRVLNFMIDIILWRPGHILTEIKNISNHRHFLSEPLQSSNVRKEYKSLLKDTQVRYTSWRVHKI